MKTEDGRFLTTAAREERRKIIVRMKKSGATYKEIQEVTGACYSSIWNASKRFKKSGSAGLREKYRGNKTGDGRRLTADQENLIQRKIIDKHPDQLKLDFALWTRGAVQQLILQETKIDLPIRTVGDYLQRWGFTPQKPAKFAYERKTEKVQEWLNVQFPEIKRRAKLDNADVYWGDETGLRASDVRGRGYAPRGKTPVVEATAKYVNLSMVSAITNTGKVHWMIVDGTVDGERFLDFIQRLVKNSSRKVFLILDNLRVHHCKPVKEWVAINQDKIELFFLPAYSPDLNPDEHLNADVKYGVGSKTPVKTKNNLLAAIDDHMLMLDRTPERIVKYFNDPAINYAKF
jgi:transposase